MFAFFTEFLDTFADGEPGAVLEVDREGAYSPGKGEKAADLFGGREGKDGGARPHERGVVGGGSRAGEDRHHGVRDGVCELDGRADGLLLVGLQV